MTERRKAKPYQPRWWALIVIRGYQKVLSPFFGQSCRFQPTCSRYGYAAIDEYGLLRGGWLTVKRIGRCNPWGPSGYDPVPARNPQPAVREPTTPEKAA